jgi:hypothetical protein
VLKGAWCEILQRVGWEVVQVQTPGSANCLHLHFFAALRFILSLLLCVFLADPRQRHNVQRGCGSSSSSRARRRSSSGGWQQQGRCTARDSAVLHLLGAWGVWQSGCTAAATLQSQHGPGGRCVLICLLMCSNCTMSVLFWGLVFLFLLFWQCF